MSAFTPKMNDDEMQCDGCGRVVGKRDNDYCTTCQPPETVDTQARAAIDDLHTGLARAIITTSKAQDTCEALAVRIEALERLPTVYESPPTHVHPSHTETNQSLTSALDRAEKEHDTLRVRYNDVVAVNAVITKERDTWKELAQAENANANRLWRKNITNTQGITENVLSAMLAVVEEAKKIRNNHKPCCCTLCDVIERLETLSNKKEL